jgi:hypothetical protein
LKVFVLLIASHICGDILFNVTFLAKAKRSDGLLGRVQGFVLHCLVHAVLVFLWLWPYEWGLKTWAVLYIFVVHFVIDFVRTYLEMTLINKHELMVVKKKQALKYLMGRADNEVNVFMKGHGRIWVLLNIGDQLLHVLAIGVFVLASSMLF